MEKSIHYSETIVNELKEKKIYEKFSECILKHIVTILISIFSVGYKGKSVNFAVHSGCHRTTIAHFLNSGKWNDDILESTVKQTVINIIYSESQKTGKPILCIIDDTIASKTKPSSHAAHPIESAYFHFSHLKKKQDYGHQAISVMLSCNGITLNYAIMIYDKSVSKIKLVSDIAKELPIAPNISYLLCDSWYTCSSIFDSLKEQKTLLFCLHFLLKLCIRQGHFALLSAPMQLYPMRKYWIFMCGAGKSKCFSVTLKLSLLLINIKFVLPVVFKGFGELLL